MSPETNGKSESGVEIDVTHGIKGQSTWDSKWFRYLVSAISIIFSLTFLYTGGTGIFDLFVQRSTFLGFSLVLVFLLYPIRDDIYGHLVDAALVALSIITNGYIILKYQEIAYQAGIPEGWLQVALGAILIGLVLEGSRRTIGLVLPALVVVFILYGMYGNYLPGLLFHNGNSISEIFGFLYLTPTGIWSFPIGIASTYIITFVIFGAFLLQTGVGQLFINLAMRSAGRITGGPAQVAVVASSLFGSVSGAAPANVATTGSITIPMMKSIGFSNDRAGAVETAASAGGLLMPPIMGAAVFLMVEFTGIPYKTIIVAALVPALLYYFGIGISIYLISREKGIGSQSKEELRRRYPHPLTELKTRGHMLIPMAVLLYLVFTNFPVVRAAVYSLIIAVIVSFLKSETRMYPREILQSLDDGGRKILEISMAVAGAGIIFAVVNQTGIGTKFASIMLEAAEVHIILALIALAGGCIILGMGLPATVAYLIVAAVGAPGLSALGFETLNAHLFIFYFAILATITPPVGLALYTAAAIAESDWLRTGIQGLKLTYAGFLVPFVFIWESSYFLEGTPIELSVGILGAFTGVTLLAMVINLKELTTYERAVFLVVSTFLFYPLMMVRVGGLVGAVGILIYFFYKTETGRKIRTRAPQ